MFLELTKILFSQTRVENVLHLGEDGIGYHQLFSDLISQTLSMENKSCLELLTAPYPFNTHIQVAQKCLFLLSSCCVVFLGLRDRKWVLRRKTEQFSKKRIFTTTMMTTTTTTMMETCPF